MKQLIALATLAASALAPTLAHAGLDSDNPLHPLVGIAITGGGDKISHVDYTDGTSQDITAGGLVQLYGGVEYHPKGAPLAFQATVGYHVDSTHARNGDQTFSRWPIEAIALFNATDKIRFGLGARYAASPKFSSGGAGYVGSADYTSQVGFLAMAEWLITPSMGVQLRYVDEHYKVHSVTYDGVNFRESDYHLNGSHGGVGFNYYF
ncbi:hypothetical protein [Scleromatobacter humisilvae]|uniref:Outer membrane protein beta-barrel domain-containing protein n=1 Tax=Scleromatobacter humisilvae TaxID=2897159 RepID=A0A9X1YNR0_9BURK|nr:hypothetical protein [Scleromatobacter humisilvae]MCK9689573.1 hypothetical protein [Scleromatobacter humisilvae]